MTQKQKICLFNSSKTWGGGEKWHYDTALHLASQGYEIVFFTNTKSVLLERIKSKNFRYYKTSLSNLSFLNPFRYLRIIKILKEEAPDSIILCLPIDVKVAGVAAKFAGIKRIIYRRGCAIPIRNSLYNRYLFKNILTNVIANSKATKESILEKNKNLFPENKIKVLYNGINFNDKLSDSTMSLKENDEIILGNAGRIVEHKKLELLIELAKILKSRNHNFKILIAGEGNLREELEAKAIKEDVQDRIQFLGFLKNITSFMNSIDIFLFPSKGEGFGYVAAEAMISKKPVIAFDICSSPELIDNEHNGYLIKPYDIDDFANKTENLILNKTIREKFGECGHDLVLERFSESTIFKEVENYLEEINPKKSVKISASIITLNEERNIEKCLKSLVGVVDEIVVVDSFSSDKTEEICKKFDARFIKNEFKGHIQQKNYAVSCCTYDYVLAIDADEQLSENLRNSIQEVKQNWDADAYVFNRLTYFCGKPIYFGDWFPDPSLRLWDRRQGRWGGHNPHDKFELNPRSTYRYIDGILNHYSYLNLESHLNQINKFSTISALSKFQCGKRSNIFKIVFYPQWRFFRDYFLMLGILDGYYGFVVCTNIAYEVFLKYVKLRHLQKFHKNAF